MRMRRSALACRRRFCALTRGTWPGEPSRRMAMPLLGTAPALGRLRSWLATQGRHWLPGHDARAGARGAGRRPASIRQLGLLPGAPAQPVAPCSSVAFRKRSVVALEPATACGAASASARIDWATGGPPRRRGLNASLLCGPGRSASSGRRVFKVRAAGKAMGHVRRLARDAAPPGALRGRGARACCQPASAPAGSTWCGGQYPRP